MDKKFTFNEKTHRYFLDKKPLTGVTTILGTIAKPALIQWSANEAVKYIKENLKDLKQLNEILEQARYAHRKKKEKAGDIGTECHKWIENWIKGIKQNEPQGDLKEMVDHFLNWVKENKIKFEVSEGRVYSEKYWYAGTMDMICEIDDKRYIGDIKTTGGIYGREPFAQCAAYRLAFEEMMGMQDFNGCVVVRIAKPSDKEKIEEYNKQEKIKNNPQWRKEFIPFEIKFSYDYETDKKIFLAALDLYRGLQTFKQSK